jgi:hypothetical protein
MQDMHVLLDTTLSIFVEQMSTELLQKLKQCKKVKHAKRFVITILPFTKRFTSGSIVTLIDLDVPAHLNKLLLPKIFSKIFMKKEKLLKK